MINIVSESIGRGGRLGLIDGGVFDRRGVGNPSIEKFGGNVFVSYRVCDYTFMSFRGKVSQAKTVWFPALNEFRGAKFGSGNVIGVLDTDSLTVGEQTAFLDDAERGSRTYSGYEDTRLMCWDGTLYASCSKPSQGGDRIVIPMSVIKLDGDFGISDEMVRGVSNVEKNWMPVEGSPMEYVYSTGSPFSVVKVTGDGLSVVKKDDSLKFRTFYKGSTQARLYRDHYVVVAHYNEFVKDNGMDAYCYRHVLLVYDKDWNFVRESEPFTFMGFPVEFTCGLLVNDDGFVYVTFSVYDNVSFVLKMPSAYFDWLAGFGGKPAETSVRSLRGTDALGYYRRDGMLMDLCGRISRAGNRNGAFALYTYVGAYSADSRTALDAYYNALLIAKDCVAGADYEYARYLVAEDRILDQIKMINEVLL